MEKTVEKKLPVVQELKFEGSSALTLMDNMDKLMKVGEFMLRSGLMPSTVKSAANVALIIWTGHELGLKPMQSIQFINVISGKPSLAPVMMRSLIIGSGEEDVWDIRENSATVCTIHAKRKSGLEYIRSFTMEEAGKIMTKEDGKTIPLTQKFNWKNMPATMLLWRCTSAICRIVYPDVINGMYIPDEMEDAHVAYDVEIIEPETAHVASGEHVEAEVQSSDTPKAAAGSEQSELMLVPKHLEDILARLKDTRSNEKKFCAALKVTSIQNIPDAWYLDVVAMLEKKAKQVTDAKAGDPAAAAEPSGATPAEALKPASAGQSVKDVVEFLKSSNITYTQEGDMINCGKSFKHKPMLTSLGFVWDGDRQGFVFRAAA